MQGYIENRNLGVKLLGALPFPVLPFFPFSFLSIPLTTPFVPFSPVRSPPFLLLFLLLPLLFLTLSCFLSSSLLSPRLSSPLYA